MAAVLAVLLFVLSSVGPPRAPVQVALTPVSATVLPLLPAPTVGPLSTFQPIEPLPRWRQPVAFGLGASAALLATAGVIFGVQAHDANQRLAARQAAGISWNDVAAADLAERRHTELLSIGAFVAAGGAAAAAGWLLFGPSHRGPDIRIAKAGRGWGLALKGHF